MRIGYCSPFNPMRSGISDFSEELLLVLKTHIEIVVFSLVKPSNEEISQQFEWHMLSDLNDDALRNSLDMIVYQVGNNPVFHGEIVDLLLKYPGIVELHDIGLHNLVLTQTWESKGEDAYIAMAEYCHGQRGAAIVRSFFDGTGGAPWEEHALDMCMNRHVIENAKGMIVHSEMAKQFVLGACPRMPVAKILLHAEIEDQPQEEQIRVCREKMDLPENALVMGSFGFATATKRIIPCLDALQQYKASQARDFIYLIVGDAQEELNLEKEIAARGLEQNVRVTGFTTLEEFKSYMGACDFCLNLRYPTQGESSASLQRMLGMGKPAIVTDVGTFSDYPDDIVLKVHHDEREAAEILAAIRVLADQEKELRERSKKAISFARKNCDLNKNAVKYCEFFRQVIHGVWQADFEDVMIERLCELGLTDEEYLEHIWSSWKEWPYEF